jgi:hypothetical protein
MSKKVNIKEKIMSKKVNIKEKSMSVKSIIIFFLVGVIVIWGGILVFNNIQNKPSSNIQNILSSDIQNKSLLSPELLVSEEEWDFGIVKPNDKPTHIFIIKNEGEGELIIGEIKKSCERLEAVISNSIIQPGESAELTVSFNVTWKGTIEKGSHPTKLQINSNDPQAPRKEIKLYIETEELAAPYLKN